MQPHGNLLKGVLQKMVFLNIFSEIWIEKGVYGGCSNKNVLYIFNFQNIWDLTLVSPQ